MILVTGATGHLGKAVIEQLLKKIPANEIVALVRDESKASDLREKGARISIGNYDDITSLDRAMRGIEKVLLISGGEADNGFEQHRNVVDAAKKAGAKCVAYTSRNLKDPGKLANDLMKRHFETEDYIKQSGLNYILFRNALYMDTLPLFVGGAKVFENGINLPAGEGKVAFALRSEMGEAMANVLAEENCENKIYNFSSAEPYSFDDVANTLSDLSGKDVAYKPIEQSLFEAQMKERGAPEAQIKKTAAFMTDIKNGQEAQATSELETLLGRRPATLKDGLKGLFNL